MPEPGDVTDKYRESPELSCGLEKPDPYPIREYIYATEDEVYQFRFPNRAYNDGSMIHDLPDGLQTDGTQPRHWGDTPVAHEDNIRDLRHNPGGEEGNVSEQERADLAKERGVAAAKIADPSKRAAFIAEQGKQESKGEYGRLQHYKLRTEAAQE